MVSDQLSGGGAERCAALLSIYLEKNNCSIHHVVVVDNVNYEYAGAIFNLGKFKNKSNGIFNRLKRFYLLNQFFKQHTFDFIVDFRVKRFQIQEFIIAKFIYNAPLFVSVQNYMTEIYFPKNLFLANNIYKNATLVGVSKQIEERILRDYNYTNIHTIYNPIEPSNFIEKAQENETIDFPYIIAIGRFTNIKQLDVAINAYNASRLKSEGIKLIILGEGEERSKLITLIAKLKLEKDVLLFGFQKNPYKFMKNALFLVMCSKFEGFPLVLIECLSCGTPIISYDCPSGPSEIIIHRENGLLVENQNQQKLTESIIELYCNKELYLHCKQNAKSSVNPFIIDTIGNQWLQLFKQFK